MKKFEIQLLKAKEQEVNLLAFAKDLNVSRKMKYLTKEVKENIFEIYFKISISTYLANKLEKIIVASKDNNYLEPSLRLSKLDGFKEHNEMVSKSPFHAVIKRGMHLMKHKIDCNASQWVNLNEEQRKIKQSTSTKAGKARLAIINKQLNEDVLEWDTILQLENKSEYGPKNWKEMVQNPNEFIFDPSYALIFALIIGYISLVPKNNELLSK